MLNPYQLPILEQIQEPLLLDKGIRLYLKREDLIHPTVSGNKWRKLKYNLIEAKKKQHTKLLTFGGTYSNHIYATAAAAKAEGLEAIGIIRGEETLPLNDTLQYATDSGMLIHYISREQYREKNERHSLDKLKEKFGEFYHIPEGGSNALAVKGCAEIMDNVDINYDIICCPVGTGGTMAGLISSLDQHTQVLGFSVLKGDGILDKAVNKLLQEPLEDSDWKINYQYHFGGYAKIKRDLIKFINEFYQQHHIILDPIYTGKMMFGLFDMISNGDFENGTTIIALHTGGHQGITGIEKRYGVKLPK